MADYEVDEAGVAHVHELIDKHQYVLESTWGDVQPDAAAENAYLERNSWDDYAWHHKKVEPAARDLLQHLDAVSGHA